MSPRDTDMSVHEAAQAWAKDPMWAQKDAAKRAKCWTCGKQMEPREWDSAPREPSDPSLRWCYGCHNRVENLRPPLALEVANMLRHVAGLPYVVPEEGPDEGPDDDGVIPVATSKHDDGGGMSDV